MKDECAPLAVNCTLHAVYLPIPTDIGPSLNPPLTADSDRSLHVGAF